MWKDIRYAVRYSLAIISSILVVGIFYGAIAMALGRWLLGLDEDTALLWCALPVFIAFIPFCVFVLPKHLRKAGII
jgi:ABC-type dipeptide/oligopeptide/nickel transport system permease subunit